MQRQGEPPDGDVESGGSSVAPSPDGARHKGSRPRSLLLLWLIGGVVLALVVGGLLATRLPKDSSGPSDTTTTQPSPGVASSASPTNPSSASPTTPEVVAPHLSLRVRLASDRVVKTSARLGARQPFSRLRLTVWSASRRARMSGYAFRPRLSRVRVTADGTPVPAPTTMRAGQSVVLRLAAPTRTVDVHFRGHGQLARTGSPVPSRALALVNAVIVSTGSAKVPVRVHLVHPRVLNVACLSGTSLPQPCGAPDRKGWHVQVSRARAATVVAQVDVAPS